MIYYRNNKIKRKKCQECVEMIWKGQRHIYLPSRIDISSKRKCVGIVKIKIMRLVMNVKIVNYHSNLCKY